MRDKPSPAIEEHLLLQCYNVVHVNEAPPDDQSLDATGKNPGRR
jgi:hypothetical protein